MNARERFNKVMHWQKADRVPNMDFGYWNETIPIWHTQGLPKEIKNAVQLEKHLKLEGMDSIPTISLRNAFLPGFKREVLEDKGDHQIIIDGNGVICEISKTAVSIPKYIKYSLETREDWDKIKKEKLDPLVKGRVLPKEQWKKLVDTAHAEGMPVRVSVGSLYGWLRNWMGVENFSIAMMTDKDWVEDMMEHLTQMTLYMIDQTLPGLEVDFAAWWEDMAYNHGPLCSPKLFEELMVPRYKRITDKLKTYGIDVNVLDCDGCIYELVPGWLESGINCMFPIEAAWTDPLELRKRWGKKALLIGGVNKLELAKGKAAIDAELAKLKPLIDDGGYIPTVDHRVPPDVSYENYLYYIEQKLKIL
ncbi:MAG: uroporphyrinogen decarboxylase family protein [Elusimicrobiota bacterium]